MKKRIFSLLLAFCLVAGLLPTAASADDSTPNPTPISVTVNNCTNGTATVEEPERWYDGPNRFSVMSKLPCVVMVEHNDGSVERLYCGEIDADTGHYRFLVNAADGDTVSIAVKGDVDLDGIVTNVDLEYRYDAQGNHWASYILYTLNANGERTSDRSPTNDWGSDYGDVAKLSAYVSAPERNTLNTLQLYAADSNNDGKVDSRDVDYLKNYLLSSDTDVSWDIRYNCYTITFDTGDGGSDVANQKVLAEETASEPTAPTKAGYSFDGWYNGATAFDFANTPVTENITLTAKWTPKTFTVTLDSNGGAINSGNVTSYTYGQSVTLPIDVTKTGYMFTGWYDNEACTGNPITAISATDIGDKTFYAAWAAIPVIPTYPPTVEPNEDGTVTVSPTNPAEDETVTVTATPEEGYAVDEVIVTDKDGNPVEVTDNGDGTYSFTQPAGNVTIKVVFKDATVVPFADVPADEYYYNAVQWAVRNGITNGTSETTFSPNAPCTRAQVVTFLWRAAGCPTINGSEMPFTDVEEGSYYETAVQWAVENGITNGTSETTFSPDAACSRAQFATLLWRSQGMPDADTANPFTDVAEDAYYTDAVLWVAENGITEGTSATTFSPDDDCTRAQTVTFLYRCLSGK